MIELIFILILVEIVVAVWLINAFHKYTVLTSDLNDKIVSSEFNGNLTEFKLALALFNKKLIAIKQKSIEDKEKAELAKVVNSIFLLFSAFNLVKKSFFKKKNINKC